MRRSLTSFGLVLAMSLWSVQSASAWNSAGHRIGANITYDLLDEATRAKAVQLFKEAPRFPFEFAERMPDSVKSESQAIQDRWIFLQSSIWADLIRGNKEYSIEKWHYINQPYFLTDLDAKTLLNKPGIIQNHVLPDNIDPKIDPANMNAVQAVQLCLQRLKSPDTTRPKKATYLLWVMHIVGDLHQPMHSTSLYSRGRFSQPGGDRGGNSIRTTKNGNLHALWDGLLGSNSATLNDIRGRAQKMVDDPKLKKLGEDSASCLDPSTWVEEGHKICKELVYCKIILDEVSSKESNPNAELAVLDFPEEYMTTAGQVARERAMQGAYRLATILKKYLD